MAFSIPEYTPPDFTETRFRRCPPVTFEKVNAAGIAPENYHATSIYPEYLQIRKGEWELLTESRMDCVIVLKGDHSLEAREFRRLEVGDLVACGRGENGEDGIFVHTAGFRFPEHVLGKFSFRTHLTRETSFSIDYDELYALLEYERENGFILWVLGPAVAFDRDARHAFSGLVKGGFVHALLAGNALAVHDIEGALFGTALGQDIYSKERMPLGHYQHLDAINRIKSVGSIEAAVRKGLVPDGIMKAIITSRVPFVLAGSIRDDGPLPEVIADAYQAQDAMRGFARRATTVIAMATQLHAIATGNMVPSYQAYRAYQSYQVSGKNSVRPVYFYTVDMSEFAVSKLLNRGSLTARSIITNVQDFVVTVERGLRKRQPACST